MYFNCENCGSRHSNTIACPYCTSIKDYEAMKREIEYAEREVKITDDHMNTLKPKTNSNSHLRLVVSNGVKK